VSQAAVVFIVRQLPVLVGIGGLEFFLAFAVMRLKLLWCHHTIPVSVQGPEADMILLFVGMAKGCREYKKQGQYSSYDGFYHRASPLGQTEVKRCAFI